MARSVEDNCYAVMWSYGTICVGCGCCEPDNHKARLTYHMEELMRSVEMLAELKTERDMLNMRFRNVKELIAEEKQKLKEIRQKMKEPAE